MAPLKVNTSTSEEHGDLIFRVGAEDQDGLQNVLQTYTVL
jgi:hypothetical protein